MMDIPHELSSPAAPSPVWINCRNPSVGPVKNPNQPLSLFAASVATSPAAAATSPAAATGAAKSPVGIAPTSKSAMENVDMTSLRDCI